MSALAPIQDIIADIKAGRMVILVDEEDRENEGDIVIAAEFITPETINFMAKHARGLICLTLTEERCRQLGINHMARDNRSQFSTAFTVSIEAAEGVTTGISAADRARTVQAAVARHAKATDIVQPGHIFPIMAKPGGVLIRAGHTEAGCDLAGIAGLEPASVICEIMNDDGTMARMDDLVLFARLHNLKIGTIRDLIEYRRRHDRLVECVSEAPFVSDYGGDWTAKTYRNKVDGTVNIVLQKGRILPGEPTLVRMHGISLYDDVLGQPGPRKRILQRAMEEVGRKGAGVIVTLMPGSSEELANEVNAGRPTMDLRSYGIGAQILADLGVQDMILLTNSHHHVVAIEGYGLNIVGEQAIN